MNRQRSSFVLVTMMFSLLLSFCMPAAAQTRFEMSVGGPFAEAVDLEAIRLSAVQEGGRFKTFDSLAREKLKFVNSSREARRIDPVLLYLDMILVPEHYVGADVIHLRKKLFRRQITQGVRRLVPPEQLQGPIAEPELARIDETGLVSIHFLDHPAVRQILGELRLDLMRTNKEVEKLESARALADARVLRTLWRAIPPPGGRADDEWISIDKVIAARLPAVPEHAGVSGTTAAVPGIDPGVAASLDSAWSEVSQAWRFQDAAAASGALSKLATSLASVAPELYPTGSRLRWEHWYYRNDKMTRTWLVYFLALPFLLIAIAYGFRWARFVGLGVFALGFGLHTFSLALRWFLAGRIPNANMFEAIITSAWFGCLVALILEGMLRRWPLKNLSALAASTYAMLAMMVGHFMPIALNSDIGVLMPVLDRTIWLYIHTNIVIASYALIFFASVTALIYLGSRLASRWISSARWKELWTGGADGGGAGPALGGAASIILGRQSRGGDIRNAGLAKSLDGATMIFLELAFISLWVGTILGAVWADVSWGRPWGWDPKEVFALNTWLVFLVLLHVRVRSKD
ncbi:MAG: cytochrome c biogenesis protein CcsA, partial [Acidobacteriota bacterium]|nr:cytochrome c biogenesis protein CcsA [Acidobacteriota bacterium]